MKKNNKNKSIRILITSLLCGLAFTYVNVSAMQESEIKKENQQISQKSNDTLSNINNNDKEESNINTEQNDSNLNIVNNDSNNKKNHKLSQRPDEIIKTINKLIYDIENKIKLNESKNYIFTIYPGDTAILENIENFLNSNTSPLDKNTKEELEKKVKQLKEKIKKIETKNNTNAKMSLLRCEYDLTLDLIEKGDFINACRYMLDIEDIVKALETSDIQVKEEVDEIIKDLKEKIKKKESEKIEEIVNELNNQYINIELRIGMININELTFRFERIKKLIYNKPFFLDEYGEQEFNEKVKKPFEGIIKTLEKTVENKKIEENENKIIAKLEKYFHKINIDIIDGFEYVEDLDSASKSYIEDIENELKLNGKYLSNDTKMNFYKRLEYTNEEIKRVKEKKNIFKNLNKYFDKVEREIENEDFDSASRNYNKIYYELKSKEEHLEDYENEEFKERLDILFRSVMELRDKKREKIMDKLNNYSELANDHIDKNRFDEAFNIIQKIENMKEKYTSFLDGRNKKEFDDTIRILKKNIEEKKRIVSIINNLENIFKDTQSSIKSELLTDAYHKIRVMKDIITKNKHCLENYNIPEFEEKIEELRKIIENKETIKEAKKKKLS